MAGPTANITERMQVDRAGDDEFTTRVNLTGPFEMDPECLRARDEVWCTATVPGADGPRVASPASFRSG